MNPSIPSPPFNLRTFDLNLLKVYDAVMTERSLTVAAHKLALTQPAVSNALRRLRDAVGDELLVRKGRGLAPTPRAEELWPAVRQALQNLEAALAPRDFDPGRSDQAFILTMADATAAELMPGLIAAIVAQAPRVALRVVPLTTRDPRRLLDEGSADLALGHFPGVLAELREQAQTQERVGFMHHRLFSGNYVCVMRKGHPLASGELTLERYCSARHLLVSFSGRAYGFVDESLALLGRSRQVVLTVNQFFTAGRVVAQTELLTVLPRHFVQVTGFAEELVQRPLPFAVAPIQVDALWHQRLDNASAHAWLRSKVLDQARLNFPHEDSAAL